MRIIKNNFPLNCLVEFNDESTINFKPVFYTPLHRSQTSSTFHWQNCFISALTRLQNHQHHQRFSPLCISLPTTRPFDFSRTLKTMITTSKAPLITFRDTEYIKCAGKELRVLLCLFFNHWKELCFE